MTRTLPAGNLRGIDIHVDWTSLLALPFIGWNVTLAFHDWHPSWAWRPTLLLALVATALLALSILVHAVAHVFVARGLDLKVQQIELFLFGGVSDVARRPASPASEFWMGITGPIVSIAIGSALIRFADLALGTLLGPADAIAGLSPTATVLFWLGPMNIALGLFNLLPGFPLDGGRILRAAIWAKTKDLHFATDAASSLGSVIGLGLVAVGISMAVGFRPLLLGEDTAGIWIAAFGWYLHGAAGERANALAAPPRIA